MNRIIIVCLLSMLVLGALTAQQRNSATFVTPKNEFIDSINSTLGKFYKKDEPVKKSLRPDFSQFQPPTSVNDFTTCWHNKPISQALSGMCWCFSTTSFLESEIYRLHKKQVKLSELYTVYWEYVEKAIGFVESRGNQEFGEGSQANAVFRSWKKHGIVPAESYTGLLNGQPFHDHTKLFDELNAYLKSVKASGIWNSNEVVETVTSILDHYIGPPPTTVTVAGKQLTPNEYLSKVLDLNTDDYLSLTSFSDRPYWEWNEYDVPDNWWHSKDYFNVPLADFMKSLKQAVHAGYGVELWGDVSEPGLEGHAGIAVVPTFDIPADYIDENSRIFRFKNGTTGDDHGIHIVGFVTKDGKDWFLIKDSGAGSRNNSHPGYYFFHEDYVKLKMLGFMVAKSAIPEIAAKAKK